MAIGHERVVPLRVTVGRACGPCTRSFSSHIGDKYYMEENYNSVTSP